MNRKRPQTTARRRRLLAVSRALGLLSLGTVLVASNVELIGTRVLGERFAVAAKADYSLTLTPAVNSVAKGSVSSFTVGLSVNNGYKGTVTLSVAVPSGSGLTTTFTPQALNDKKLTSTLNIATAAASVGTWSFTVSGTDGALTRSIGGTLTVNPSPAKFTLGVTPSTSQVLPGDVAEYSITITRASGFTAAVALAVTGGPTGSAVTLTPTSPVVGSSTTLHVITATAGPMGTFVLQITGSAVGASSQTVTAQLTVTDKGKPFGISGSPSGMLAPGAAPLLLNLSLSNPNNQAMEVTSLTVAISGTSAGGACPASNYAVVQYSGVYPINLGKGQTATLNALGAPVGQLPTVSFVDDPLNNQDACKGVTVFLAYAGTGTGATS